MRDEISAFIVCCNEELDIERCLSSLTWCDEIIIVDSGSTDNTLEICKKYTDKIYHNEWKGFREQKQFGLDLCTKKWVLNLDADEAVSPELQKNILQILQNSAEGKKTAEGYNINRVVYFLNRWWKNGGWYPEYRLRLMQKEKTVWGGNNPHEKAIVSGTINKVSGDIYHFSFSEIADQINTLNKHSSVAAKDFTSRQVKFSIFNLIFNPIVRFLKFYFLKKGFLEGTAGFIVSINEAFYTFLKYAKMWELQRNKGK